MNDMRKLLSSAFPPPEDEPHARDVVGPAMEWGERRKRRDWALAGAAALAVIAMGAGAAVVSGGGSGSAAPGSGGTPASPHQLLATGATGAPSWPAGTRGTENCSPDANGTSSNEFCRLYLEEQGFDTSFAKASAPYIRAALPAGYTVQTTDKWVLILTGPNGKTNFLFPSVTGAGTLDGHAPSCGTPPAPGCVETSTAGGSVMVNGASPSGEQSAGYVKDGVKDPRITINVGTAASGGMNGIPAPTSTTALLTNEQMAKVVGNQAFVEFSKQQYAHLKEIIQRLQSLSPPSATGSGSMSSPPPTGVPSATGSSLPTGSSATSGPPATSGASGSWSPPSYTNSSVPGTPLGSQTRTAPTTVASTGGS